MNKGKAWFSQLAPSKLFKNEPNVLLQQRKAHKAFLQAITAVSTIYAPLQLLHIDLFGPTFIRSIDHKQKHPYELLSGKVPNISHLKPFGCLVTILNTSDHLGKFEGKADEGFIVGYAAHSYTRFKSNQPASTQDTHIHAASKMVENNSDYAEELARLQRQGHEARDIAKKYGFGFSKDTEELLRQADMVPASRIDPATSIFAGSIDHAASISIGSAEPFPTVIERVHADETSLPPGHSLGS
ncbi:hypothetical protein Tco_0738535, partial [Tanacetum coccineum]